MMTSFPPLALLATAILAGAQGPPAQGPPAQIRGGINVDPDRVAAGMFYTGTTVHVSAVVPADANVAMACLGESHALRLEKKGKALGVVWMNVGNVSFADVPDLYLLRISDALDQLAPPAVRNDLTLGLDAVEARAGPGPGADTLFGELARLKRRDRLWGVAEHAVDIRPAGGGMALATTDFTLPPKAKPGVYRVLVYAFRDGTGGIVGEGQVRVQQVGLAAVISSLAVGHGLLYGVLAALVAVVVGLATGIIFGLGSRGGH